MSEALRWLLRGKTCERPPPHIPDSSPASGCFIPGVLPLTAAVPVPLSLNIFVLMSEVKEGLWRQWVMLGASPMAETALSRLD